MEPEKRIVSTERRKCVHFSLITVFSVCSGAPKGGRARAAGTHGAAGWLAQRADVKKAAGKPTTLFLTIFKYIIYIALQYIT